MISACPDAAAVQHVFAEVDNSGLVVGRGFIDSYRGDGWSVSSPNAVSGQLPSGRRPGQTIVRKSEASRHGDHGRSSYSQHLFLAQKHGRLGSLGLHATSGLVTRRSPRRRQTLYEYRQAPTEQARVLLGWSRQLALCSANGLQCVFRKTYLSKPRMYGTTGGRG